MALEDINGMDTQKQNPMFQSNSIAAVSFASVSVNAFIFSVH